MFYSFIWTLLLRMRLYFYGSAKNIWTKLWEITNSILDSLQKDFALLKTYKLLSEKDDMFWFMSKHLMCLTEDWATKTLFCRHFVVCCRLAKVGHENFSMQLLRICYKTRISIMLMTQSSLFWVFTPFFLVLCENDVGACWWENVVWFNNVP